MKYKIVFDCIIYILYYILAYIQHNGDVSLERKSGSNHLRWYVYVVVGFATTYKHPAPVPPDVVLMCRSSLVRCACVGLLIRIILALIKIHFELRA